jgi:hypothetical protein
MTWVEAPSTFICVEGQENRAMNVHWSPPNTTERGSSACTASRPSSHTYAYITNPYINTVALTGPSETTERSFLPAPPSIPTTVSCSDGVHANRVHHQQQQHCALARPARAAALLPSHTRWRSDAVVGYQPEVCYFRF